jgi:uncharacterized protein YdaU (DUF1376 family)
VSFAFLPWYTGDYLRDTRHLSCSEHGIYLLFLACCWDQRGPLPLDERKVAAICNARSSDEIEAMRRILQEFFVRMADGYYNKRMQREIERADAISFKRSTAGRKGFQAKAKQVPGKSLAPASTPTPTPTPTLTTTPILSNKDLPLSGDSTTVEPAGKKLLEKVLQKKKAENPHQSFEETERRRAIARALELDDREQAEALRREYVAV